MQHDSYIHANFTNCSAIQFKEGIIKFYSARQNKPYHSMAKYNVNQLITHFRILSSKTKKALSNMSSICNK
jgi:hypothetical protein